MNERTKQILTRWLGSAGFDWLRARKRDWDAFNAACRHGNWQYMRVRRYYRENSIKLYDEGRLVEWPLDERSLVVDVGGFRGDWAWTIARKYNSRILVIEPVPDYCAQIKARFAARPNVSVFNLGLLDHNGEMAIDVAEEGSSFFGKPHAPRNNVSSGVRVPIMDVADFLDLHRIAAVDLMKLNIEGGEYPVLRRLIDTGRISTIHRLLVEFHAFYPQAHRLRRAIQRQLSKTHECVFDYPFFWECWQRRPTT